MATREASIKVTIDGGAFRTGMRRLGTEAQTVGRKMGAALKGPVKEGFAAAKNAAGDLMSSVKSTAGTLATLGGAVSAGALVKSAVDAERAYIQLSEQLSIATGEAVSQADAQAIVERSVDATRGSIDETRLALNQLAGASRDINVIEDALKRSTLQAQRFGVPVDLVARATSRVLAKGIAESGEEAELLLETMNRFGRTVLGIDPDEAIDPNDIAEFAAFANTTNSSVTDLTNLLGRTGDQVKDLGQAFEVVEELGLALNTRLGLEKVRKQARLSKDEINLTNGSVENLLRIIETGSPRALKALEENLATDRSKAALANILGEQLTIDIAAGKATKEQIREVGTRLREELETAGDRTAEIARIQETNAKLTNTSAAKFQAALNRLETAMADPKVVAAINTLADKLPALAEEMAKLVQFIAEEPLKAALIALAARITLAAAGGAAGAAGKGLLGAAGKALGFGGAAAAGGGATAAAGGGAAAAGGSAAAGGALAVGAAVAGAAAAGAVVGTAINKTVVEPAIEAEFDAIQGGTQEVLASAFSAQLSDSAEKKREALALIARQRQAIDQNESMITGVVGELAAMFTDVKTPEEQRREALLQLSNQEAKLEAQLARRRDTEQRIARAGDDLARSLAGAARAVKDTTRGTDAPPASQPGAGTTAPTG